MRLTRILYSLILAAGLSLAACGNGSHAPSTESAGSGSHGTTATTSDDDSKAGTSDDDDTKASASSGDEDSSDESDNGADPDASPENKTPQAAAIRTACQDYYDYVQPAVSFAQQNDDPTQVQQMQSAAATNPDAPWALVVNVGRLAGDKAPWKAVGDAGEKLADWQTLDQLVSDSSAYWSACLDAGVSSGGNHP